MNTPTTPIKTWEEMSLEDRVRQGLRIADGWQLTLIEQSRMFGLDPADVPDKEQLAKLLIEGRVADVERRSGYLASITARLATVHDADLAKQGQWIEQRLGAFGGRTFRAVLTGGELWMIEEAHNQLAYMMT